MQLAEASQLEGEATFGSKTCLGKMGKSTCDSFTPKYITHRSALMLNRRKWSHAAIKSSVFLLYVMAVWSFRWLKTKRVY